ncbi:hypothetical protein MAPG_04966 [Magnaporthiopsis poae ATCC 64411]|uniref:Uncharacterized protein n=1 Tax=Magnaporthiopsis poae (strain ATCC 64411 / 73-15) TaxID=644358 RepID=A0A0C4DY56_MAGP6|nr:hypothetical protein MAPG_04966 [Magnaporthiopsis poae ATCC 64411]
MSTPPVQGGGAKKPRKRDRVKRAFGLSKRASSQERSRDRASGTTASSADRNPASTTSLGNGGPAATTQAGSGDPALRLWDAAYQELKASSDTADLVAKYEGALQSELGEAATTRLLAGTSGERVLAMQDIVKKAGTSKHGAKAAEAAETTLKILNMIKGTVSELAQANPIAAFAWAGFCTVTPNLLAPIMENKTMRNGLDHITGRMKWFMALSRVLLRESWSNDAEFQRFREVLDDKMVALYRKLLEFEVRCVCAWASPFLAAAKDMVGWHGWDDLVTSIKTVESELNADISQYSTEALKQYLMPLGDIKTQLEVHSRYLEQISEIQERAEKLDIKRERNKTIGKFHVANYNDVFERVPDKVPGTCEWLRHNETYRQWLGQRASDSSSEKSGTSSGLTDGSEATVGADVLVIAAGPGWGKSVLSKDLVSQRLQTDLGPDWLVCHFFFHYNQPGINSASNALRAIIDQLLSKQRHLIDGVTDQVSRYGGGPITGISDLTEIFIATMSNEIARPIMCVIDALDECVGAELNSFVRFLHKARQLPRVRFVVTTRPWPIITDELRRELGSNRKIIDSEAVQQDILQQEIMLVLDHSLDEVLREKNFDKSTKSKLRTALTTKVDQGERTYLWLKLVLDGLRSARLKADAQRLIDQPPKGLYEAYSMLLSRVDQDSRDSLTILLHLVLVSERPLSLDEASLAVWLRTCHPQPDSIDDVDPDSADDFGRWVLETSGFFISVYNGQLYFIHQTCREYLTRNDLPSTSLQRGINNAAENSSFANSITEPQAHATMAECCLLYLLLRPDPSQEFLDLNESSPDLDKGPGRGFMRYAVAFLAHHFGLCQRHVAGALLDIEPSLGSRYTSLIRRYLDSGRCCLEFYGDELFSEKLSVRFAGLSRCILVLRYLHSKLYLGRDKSYAIALTWHSRFQNPTRLWNYEPRRADHPHRSRHDAPTFSALPVAGLDPVLAGPPMLQTVGALTGHLLLFQKLQAGDLEMSEPPIEYVGPNNEEYCDKIEKFVPTYFRYFTKPSPPLIRVSSIGGADIVRWLIARGVSSSVEDADGNTLLHVAVQYLGKGSDRYEKVSYVASQDGFGVVDTLKVLLQAGLDSKLTNKSGRTPLMSAAELGNWDAVKTLLNHDADPNVSNDKGETPLLLAAQSGLDHESELASLALLERKANPNVINERGETPLMLAAWTGKTRLVTELLKKGSQANSSDHDNNNALHHATSSNPEIVEALIRYGVNVDQRNKAGKTPLAKAMTRPWVKPGYAGPPPNVPAAHFLTGNTEGVDIADNGGWTALRHAERPEDFEALLKAGADLSLAYPSRNLIGARPDIILVLLRQGFPADATDSEGATVLHHLMSGLNRSHGLDWPDPQKTVTLIQELVKAGCPVDKRESMGGQTAAHILLEGAMFARRRGHGGCSAFSTCFKTLVEQGADTNAADEEGRTVLHYLCRSQLTEEFVNGLCQALVEEGSKINARDLWGRTPFHYVCRYQERRWIAPMCQTLIGLGADCSALDAAGASAMHAWAANEKCLYEYFDEYFYDWREWELTKSDFDTILQLLLDNGMTLQDKDSEGWTFFDEMCNQVLKYQSTHSYQYGDPSSGNESEIQDPIQRDEDQRSDSTANISRDTSEDHEHKIQDIDQDEETREKVPSASDEDDENGSCRRREGISGDSSQGHDYEAQDLGHKGEDEEQTSDPSGEESESRRHEESDDSSDELRGLSALARLEVGLGLPDFPEYLESRSRRRKSSYQGPSRASRLWDLDSEGRGTSQKGGPSFCAFPVSQLLVGYHLIPRSSGLWKDSVERVCLEDSLLTPVRFVTGFFQYYLGWLVHELLEDSMETNF